MPAGLLVALAVLGTAPVVRGDVTVGAGGWSRLASGDETALHGGLALLPQAELSLLSPGSEWTLRYAPALFSDASGSAIAAWQQAVLKGRFAWTPRASLEASLDAGFGTNERLAGSRSNDPFDALDLLRPVIDDDLELSADVGGSYSLGPLDRLDVSTGYFARGGTTEEARRWEPFQNGPELYAGYAHSLSEIESLGATFYGASSSSTSGRTSDGRLELAWTRNLSRTFRAKLTAGASVSVSSQRPGATLAPAGSARLDWLSPTREGDGGLTLAAAYAPRMDPLTGERGNRAELSAALTRALTGECALRARTGIARQLGVASFAVAGGDLIYRQRSGWSLALEVEAVHQARGGEQETFLRVFTRAAYALHDVL